MSEFAVLHAARQAQSVSVGLFGPSGCGKTLSALRLATGFQSVVGGNIYVIDTENRRALDYSDEFSFEHVDFAPPFGSDRYLKAIEKVREHGAPGPRTIILDSLSHEHESEGGMLEQFEAELARLGDRGGKDNFRAWIKPKALRRKLVVRMEQMRDVNFIMTFRAADQTKPDGKGGAIHLGFMPIGGREFVYSTKMSCYLPPGADGTPVWNPEFVGEKMMRRLPRFLASVMNDGKPLSEEHGKRIMEWASGVTNGQPKTSTQKAPNSLQDRVEKAIKIIKSKTIDINVKDAYGRAEGLIRELREASRDDLVLKIEAAYNEQMEFVRVGS